MSYSSTILGDSPTAYYEMNESSGTTATDSSGNGYSGTLHGGVSVNQTALLAALGVCYKFDGAANTYISLPNGARQAAPCTFEMWIKDNGISSNGFWFSASLAAVESGWDVSASNTIYIGGNGANFTTGSLTSGTIYYVAITVDSSMNFSGYYAKSTDSDVTALGSANPGGSSINYGSNALYLGARNDGTLNWQGWMSNVAIYPTVLTAAKAKAHFLAGAGSATTNTRTIPATAAFLATKTRPITATAALLATKTRTIPATVALLATSKRTIPATAALAIQRIIPATAALFATKTRTIPAHAALLQTDTRTIPTSAALKHTSTRTVPATAALLQTSTRSISATAAFYATVRRIPCTAALTGNVSSNLTCYVRSGEASFIVR